MKSGIVSRLRRGFENLCFCASLYVIDKNTREEKAVYMEKIELA